jgi:hypothetical protein
MDVELLVTPGCPHASAARTVVTDCLNRLGLSVPVRERVGDYPSPTVLVDGVDVMTGTPGVAPVPACRLDLPTAPRVLAALRARSAAPVTATSDGVVMAAAPDWYPLQLAVGVLGDRISELTPAARLLHTVILRAFAATGHAPALATIAAATPPGHQPAVLLRELHDRDVIRLDDEGRVAVAYPFSGTPTPHRVTIDGGPQVYAMCAIDALGIAAMLGRDVVITSADPVSGRHIRVSIQDGHPTWSPDTAVVVVGADTATDETCCPPGPPGECTVPAADRCCEVMNFFASQDTAHTWIGGHPTVSAVVLAQAQAMRLGVDIFGHLLDQ